MAFKSSQPLLQQPLCVACIQMASGPDKQENLRRARENVLEAASKGARLVVLPECFNSPYSTALFPLYAEPLPPSLSHGNTTNRSHSSSPTFSALANIARNANVYLVGGTLPERDEQTGKIYNTCPIYSPTGTLLATHRKLHLFDIHVPDQMAFRESDTLSAGNAVTVVHLPGYGKLGIGICYDMRFPEPAAIAARAGAFALVYPSAFNTTTGPLHWELLGRSCALDNQVYAVSCSQARGTGGGYPAWGFSMVADPMGRVVVQARESDGIVYADLDDGVIWESREAIPVSGQRRFDVYLDVSWGVQ
ncbi:nitrilase family protein-like protein [Aspergillus karnatakaensis]|uniref:carbon-nitrogen hydrolase family protein n=1 Tax=Aspergillus karnatakaensis TaxID=1810916 RepID=UPI003CCD019C